MEQQLQQAIQFFKTERAYEKLFKLFKSKYESLGRIGGNVSIAKFTKEEVEVISRFFGIPAGEIRSKGTVSLLLFEKQLANTRFHNLGLKQLLDAYFGKEIISNKEKRAKQEASLRSHLFKLRSNYPSLAFWIDFLLEHPREGRWILRFAEEKQDQFNRFIHTLAKAIENLPSKPERLPIFSQRITGNPHAFDLDTDVGKMFLHVLAVNCLDRGASHDLAVPTDTEAINELFMTYHLYRDDLLNFITCANLYAETNEGLDKVWVAAAKQHSVQIVPLRELIRLVRAYPAKGRKVWIVENSGVCSALLDIVPNAPIICTNGQFTLAAYMLLDLLVKDDCLLYYAGDFDPEGLGMAQRLVKRYPANVQLWHMHNESYQKTNPVKKLTKERLEKLNGIVQEELLEVAEMMRKVGKAGYQEALVDEMARDISENI